MKRLHLFVIVFLLGLSGTALADTYKVDVDHSSINFKVRHLLSNTQGQFKQFEGSFDYDPAAPETSKAEVTAQVESIDTNVPERDKHLKTPDFFDAAKYPVITFKSTKFTPAGEGKAKLEGLLNMHGVEKPVTFDVEIHGVANDAWGNVRSAFTATGAVNRKDFGITWNKTLDNGGVMVGEEVKITIEVEGIKQ